MKFKTTIRWSVYFCAWVICLHSLAHHDSIFTSANGAPSFLVAATNQQEASAKNPASLKQVQPPKHFQRVSDFALDQRSCMTFQIGFDYFETMIVKSV